MGQPGTEAVVPGIPKVVYTKVKICQDPDKSFRCQNLERKKFSDESQFFRNL